MRILLGFSFMSEVCVCEMIYLMEFRRNTLDLRQPITNGTVLTLVGTSDFKAINAIKREQNYFGNVEVVIAWNSCCWPGLGPLFRGSSELVLLASQLTKPPKVKRLFLLWTGS